MERREFIGKVAFGGSVLLAAPVLFNACSNGTDEVINDTNNNTNSGAVTIDLTNATYANLQNVGGYVYKSDIIIVRVSDAQYIALSSVCTHQGCTVQYSSTDTAIVCPCHGSKYTTLGAVTQGPATASLKKYSVKVDGNTLTIS